ncbi:MAG: hypothetical protein PHH82_03605 [Candidatus ainarchaeum sp.]|nr:hypothetical protein [Candidatus ainarchaeum sp.]
MDRKVIFVIIGAILLFILIANSYSYSTFDMEKQIKAQNEDFSIEILPEAEYLSLQQGSFSILKLGIDIDSYYKLKLNYVFESDLEVTSPTYMDNTNFSYSKAINIKVPSNTEPKEYKILIKLNANNGFKSTDFEKEIIVKVTEKEGKYSFSSNTNNSTPVLEVVSWDYTTLAIGKNNPSEKVIFNVKNTGANSDFFPVFKNDENCFVVKYIPMITNIPSNETKSFVFAVDYNSEVGFCKDTEISVSLRDSHTNKEYFLGKEAVLFRDNYEPKIESNIETTQTNTSGPESNVDNPTSNDLTSTNNPTSPDYSKDSNTGIIITEDKNTNDTNTVIPISGTSTSLNSKPTALFAMENRAITIGAIVLIVLIFAVIIFRGGFMNNTKNVKKLVKQLQKEE